VWLQRPPPPADPPLLLLPLIALHPPHASPNCTNHQNITKYQGDPEIMKVLEKVTEIFSPQMQGQK
jgi:hypothetical protein